MAMFIVMCMAMWITTVVELDVGSFGIPDVDVDEASRDDCRYVV